MRYGPDTDLREVYPARGSRELAGLRAKRNRPPLRDITDAVREYQAGNDAPMVGLLKRFPLPEETPQK